MTSVWPDSVDVLQWLGTSDGPSLLGAGRAWSHSRQSTLHSGGLYMVLLQDPTTHFCLTTVFLFGHVACGILVPPTRGQTWALSSGSVGS